MNPQLSPDSYSHQIKVILLLLWSCFGNSLWVPLFAYCLHWNTYELVDALIILSLTFGCCNFMEFCGFVLFWILILNSLSISLTFGFCNLDEFKLLCVSFLDVNIGPFFYSSSI